MYTANKSMVYRDNLYNMTDVQQISYRMEGTLADGEVKNMKDMNKKAVETLLKANAPVMVSMIVQLDDKAMAYQRQKVSKYSQYSKMSKSFDKAMSSITKFMADGKATQLKLK